MKLDDAAPDALCIGATLGDSGAKATGRDNGVPRSTPCCPTGTLKVQRANGPASPRPWRVLLVVLVAAVSWLAFTPDPPAAADTGWDKLNHVLAFAALAACGWLAWGAARGRVAGVVLGTLAYGVLVELVQMRIPGRTGEWPDLLADAVGVAAGLALVMTASRFRLTP